MWCGLNSIDYDDGTCKGQLNAFRQNSHQASSLSMIPKQMHDHIKSGNGRRFDLKRLAAFEGIVSAIVFQDTKTIFCKSTPKWHNAATKRQCAALDVHSSVWTTVNRKI